MTQPDPAMRVMLRPLASPLPAGFLALAVGSFVLGGLQLKWIDAAQGHAVALCLIAFVVPLQLISSVFGFLARDEGVGTGMGVLAGSWFAIGLVTLTSPPGQVSGALGLLLVAAAGALVVVIASAVITKPLGATVVGLTAVRFCLAGIYELNGDDGWRTATGVVGIVLSGLAWYAALAFAVEDARRSSLLPTFRSLPEADGVSDRSLAREAAVRRAL